MGQDSSPSRKYGNRAYYGFEMSTTPHGAPSEVLQERDVRLAAALREIVRDPSIVANLDEETVIGDVDFCLARLRLVRMGGRSVGLVGLSVILWFARHPEKLRLNVEEILVTAFGISMDPSYIWPEWGIVLAGVFIARYLPLLPDGTDGQKKAKLELSQQCRLRLAHLHRQVLPAPLEAVGQAAKALEEAWDNGFSEGLQRVTAVCKASWPDAPAFAATSAELLRARISALDLIQPAWYTTEDRALYRLSMERADTWLIADVVLGKH